MAATRTSPSHSTKDGSSRAMPRTRCQKSNLSSSAASLPNFSSRIVASDASYAVSEIELELKRGEPAELFKLARTISDIVPAQIDVKSKSERGFDLVEKASIAAEKAYEPELSTGTTAGRAFT